MTNLNPETQIKLGDVQRGSWQDPSLLGVLRFTLTNLALKTPNKMVIAGGPGPFV